MVLSLSKKKLIGLMVTLATLALVVPAFAQTGGVIGSCKGKDGKPLVKYPITIARQEYKQIYKTKTDKHGNYVYIGLPVGNYKVTIYDPTNNRPLYYIMHHVGLGDPTEVNFDFRKIQAAANQGTPSQLPQGLSPEDRKKLQEQIRKQQEEQKKQQEAASKAEKQFAGLKKFFDEGTQLYNQKSYAQAAEAYQKALPFATGKNVAVVLTRLADTYYRAHEYDKAAANYQKAIAARPDDANLHNNLGNVYAEMGKIPDAEQEYQKAATMDPAGASRYYYNMGAVLYNIGKMDDAVAAFKKSAAADPKFADAYFMEGRALMAKMTLGPNGKVVPAPGTIEALQTYLKLEPNGKFSADANSMLQTLEGKVQTRYQKSKKKR